MDGTTQDAPSSLGPISTAHVVDRFRIKIWKLGTEAVAYDNQVACSDDSLDTYARTAV